MRRTIDIDAVAGMDGGIHACYGVRMNLIE
jgi:hypothetical protein